MEVVTLPSLAVRASATVTVTAIAIVIALVIAIVIASVIGLGIGIVTVRVIATASVIVTATVTETVVNETSHLFFESKKVIETSHGQTHNRDNTQTSWRDKKVIKKKGIETSHSQAHNRASETNTQTPWRNLLPACCAAARASGRGRTPLPYFSSSRLADDLSRPATPPTPPPPPPRPIAGPLRAIKIRRPGVTRLLFADGRALSQDIQACFGIPAARRPSPAAAHPEIASALQGSWASA